jgi:hypothetical protein
LRICYFGSYEKRYPRNSIVLKGLYQNEVEVYECHVPLWEKKTIKDEKFGFSLTFLLHFFCAQIRLIFQYILFIPKHDIIIVGYIGHLDMYGGHHRYIPALASQKRFKIAEIQVKHYPRKDGISKYGGNRLFHGFFDLITILFFNRYIQRPLHLFGFFGLFCIITCLAIEIYVVGLKIFIGHSFYTHMALMLFGAMLFILGLWFFSIGIIAEMITRQNQNQESRVKQII